MGGRQVAGISAGLIGDGIGSGEDSGRMVRQHDVRGDLHTHSTYSDGMNDLTDMARAALAMGYEYLAITDHAETSHVKSHTAATLAAQRREIDAINKQLAGRLTILQGVELDIGPDGSLPEVGGMVHEVDLVIASLHSHFELDRAEMTGRVEKALSQPYVNILGHPTARRTGTRPPVDMDLETVFEAAAENGVALEINSTPTRLDLGDEQVRLARKYGCKFSIDTDSHAASGLGRVALGVEIAQMAGLRPPEVINCLSLDDLRASFGKSRD